MIYVQTSILEQCRVFLFWFNNNTTMRFQVLNLEIIKMPDEKNLTFRNNKTVQHCYAQNFSAYCSEIQVRTIGNIGAKTIVELDLKE